MSELFKMNRAITRKWITTLRSDRFKQTKNKLKHGPDRRCCLGVLCDIFSEHTGTGEWKRGKFSFEGVSEGDMPPHTVRDALLSHGERTYSLKDAFDKLAGMNDSGQSFDQIADEITRKFRT